jgi:hypothetical protein
MDADAILAQLQVPNAGGLKFPRRLAVPLAEYLAAQLQPESWDEVKELGASAFGEACKAAAGDLPTFLVTAAVEWFVGTTVVFGAVGGRGPPKRGGPHTPARSTSYSPYRPPDAPDGLDGGGEDDDADIDDKILAKDMEAMGLESKERIQAFDLSAHAGDALGEDKVEDLPYGTPAHMTAYQIEVLRKTETATLPKLVDRKDATKIRAHFNKLVKRYQQQGGKRIREITLLTTFVNKTNEAFAGDDEGFCTYIGAYREKYPGRGFPVEFDVHLFVLGMKAVSAATVKKEMTSSLKEVTSELTKVKGELDKTKAAVESLKGQVKSLRESKGGGDSSSKVKCYNCQQFGHRASECTNPKKPRKDAEEDDKEDE